MSKALERFDDWIDCYGDPTTVDMIGLDFYSRKKTYVKLRSKLPDAESYNELPARLNLRKEFF